MPEANAKAPGAGMFPRDSSLRMFYDHTILDREYINDLWNEHNDCPLAIATIIMYQTVQETGENLSGQVSK
jgi:hypothetical protein